MKEENQLEGKTIVVTGATSGIGLAAAKELAGRGARLIVVGRSAQRGKAACEAILAEQPEARVEVLTADLASLSQVRRLAEQIRAAAARLDSGKLDVLVNNAGTVASWHTATEDGYELQFAVNHLAPFLLTNELLPLLQAAPASRVLTVSSGSHYGTRMHWKDVMYRRGYHVLRAYQQTKLANVLFTAELNRRLGPGSKVRAYAIDPGLVNTDIGMKGTSAIVSRVWKWRASGGVPPEKGAETVVFLASESELSDPEAIYWKDCKPFTPSREALKPEEAARLWELSARLCGVETGRT